MKSRAQRWDVVIGALASLIAIVGLLLSLALGNTWSIGFGYLRPETQKFMAVLAGIFLVLVAIKTSVRYRQGCRWNLEQLLKRRRPGA